MNETLSPPAPPTDELPPVAPPPDEAAAPVEPKQDASSQEPPVTWAERGLWLLKWIWNYLVGAIICQSLILSVIAIGWTQRLVRRAVARRWFYISHGKFSRRQWEEFALAEESTAALAYSPRWFWRQTGPEWKPRDEGFFGFLRYTGCLIAFPFQSLWANIREGVLTLLNTWVLTMPACVLWLYSWHAGWNNSFNKIYEQHYVGYSTAFIGIALFIAAMMIVPLAQVCQASTGRWRSFFDFSVIVRLIKSGWLSSIALAGLYSLASLVVSFFLILPGFLPNDNPDFDAMSDLELLGFLRGYYLVVALIGFALFVGLRMVAARIYAKSAVKCIQKGWLSSRDFSEREQRILKRLELHKPLPQTQRHAIIRAGAWSGRRIYGVAGIILLILIWFSFVAQIFVREFFNYHPVRAWLNQPLVQAPGFNYIPGHLLEAERQAKAQQSQAEATGDENDADSG